MSSEVSERARELLLGACRYQGIEPPPGHMLLAPFAEDAGPWLAALRAIESALSAPPSPIDDGVTQALRHARTFIENRFSDLSPEKRATVAHINRALASLSAKEESR